jgi:hypothetical protein
LWKVEPDVTSDPENPAGWNAVNTARQSISSNIIQAFALNHRELWLFGSRTTEVWDDSRLTPGFPCQPIPGAFLE